MTITFPDNVKNDSQRYEFLISLYFKTRSCKVENIVLDFINTDWFEGNMVAVLGAIVDGLKEKLNTVKAINLLKKYKQFSKKPFFKHSWW